MAERLRYNLIDNLRAFSIISMVLYHAAWDLVFLYGFDWQWYKNLPGFIWQQSICWCFIILAGFCHSMGRKPFKNALKVFSAGLLVSAVTWIITPNIRITFGVLTLIGSSGLIVCVCNKLLRRIKPELGLALFALFFLLFREINRGYLGFSAFELCSIPKSLYANYFTAFIGLPPKGFYSSDYFSLLPWLNLYLFGYYLHKVFSKYSIMKLLSGRRIKAFSWLSKHSLIIYLLHQPVISALFYLIF